MFFIYGFEMASMLFLVVSVVTLTPIIASTAFLQLPDVSMRFHRFASFENSKCHQILFPKSSQFANNDFINKALDLYNLSFSFPSLTPSLSKYSCAFAHFASKCSQSSPISFWVNKNLIAPLKKTNFSALMMISSHDFPSERGAPYRICLALAISSFIWSEVLPSDFIEERV